MRTSRRALLRGLAASAAAGPLATAAARAAAAAPPCVATRAALSCTPGLGTLARVAGYERPGDGGGALYRRVASEPEHAGKVPAAEGGWWEIAEAEACPRMFGARGDGRSDDSEAFAAALAACGTVRPAPGTYLLARPVILGDNQSIIGAGREATIILVPAGMHAFVVAGGQTAPNGDFRTNISVEGCGFVSAEEESTPGDGRTPAGAPGNADAARGADPAQNGVGPSPDRRRGTALYAVNVRGLRFSNNACRGLAGLIVSHAFLVGGSYRQYREGGFGRGIDPAVLAGFSATHTDDLNEDIEFTNNIVDGETYQVDGIRLNFTKGALIANNTLRYARISWWGGSAKSSKGGDLKHLRRVRDVKIIGNHTSYNNGGIYGNKGENILISGNLCENSVDTAIDLEGCVNCVVDGNTVRNAGNFCFSIFYGSRNNVFSNNIGIQDGSGADLAAELGITEYTRKVKVLRLADSGEGRVRVSLARSARLRSGQKVRLVGTPFAAINDRPWSIAVIDETTIDLEGSTFEGRPAAGGMLHYQTGDVFFAFRTAGFGKDEDVEASIIGNTFEWRGRADCGRISPGNLSRVAFRDNVCRNVIIDLTTRRPGTQEIVGNALTFTQAPLRSAALLAAKAGGADHQARITDNSLTCSVRMPPGTAAILAEAAGKEPVQVTIARNVVSDAAGSLAAGLVLVASGGGRDTAHRFLVEDNRVPSIVDRSEPGAAEVRYRGNSRGDGEPIPAAQR